MSLELALAENTAALKALLAHLQSGPALRQPTPEEVDANIKALNAAQPEAAQQAPKPQAAPKRGTAAATTAAHAPTPPTAEAAAADAAPAKTDAASTPAAASAAAAAPASTAATDPADAPDYATTARAINDLVKACGRQAAVDVLAQFGAETLKAVQPDQFAAVIAACAEVTA